MSGEFELIVFPDVEANLIQMLTGDSALAGFADLNISASYIGYTNGTSWVHLYRSGGLPTWPIPDVASIYVDVLAADRATASAIARTVHALLFSNRGTTVGTPGSGMLITKVVDIAGMAWLPDEANLPRYTFAVQVTARPI